MFDVERFEVQAIKLGLTRRRVADHIFAARFTEQRHGDVDVLEDLARSDAHHTVRRFDEVVASASGVLAAEGIDEAKVRTELLGFDQEASAVRLPLL